MTNVAKAIRVITNTKASSSNSSSVVSREVLVVKKRALAKKALPNNRDLNSRIRRRRELTRRHNLRTRQRKEPIKPPSLPPTHSPELRIVSHVVIINGCADNTYLGALDASEKVSDSARNAFGLGKGN